MSDDAAASRGQTILPDFDATCFPLLALYSTYLFIALFVVAVLRGGSLCAVAFWRFHLLLGNLGPKPRQQEVSIPDSQGRAPPG